MREAIYIYDVDKVGEEAPLKEEIIIASLKGGTKEPKDITSPEKAEGVAYNKEPRTNVSNVFIHPRDLGSRVPFPKTEAREKSIETYLNLSDEDIDITNLEVGGMPSSYYKKLLEELKQSYYEEIGKRLEALPRRYPQHIEELVDELPYEDFVRLTYRALEKHGKTPIDLAYDLLSEMARELYQIAINKYLAEREDFRINFEDKENLPAQLRKLRKSLKIGERKLSRYSSLSRGYISQIETHKYNPSITSLLQYLHGLKRIISERLY